MNLYYHEAYTLDVQVIWAIEDVVSKESGAEGVVARVVHAWPFKGLTPYLHKM